MINCHMTNYCKRPTAFKLAVLPYITKMVCLGLGKKSYEVNRKKGVLNYLEISSTGPASSVKAERRTMPLLNALTV